MGLHGVVAFAPARPELDIVLADRDAGQPGIERLAGQELVAHAAADPAQRVAQPREVGEAVLVVGREAAQARGVLGQPEADPTAGQAHVLSHQAIEGVEIDQVVGQQETRGVVIEGAGWIDAQARARQFVEQRIDTAARAGRCVAGQVMDLAGCEAQRRELFDARQARVEHAVGAGQRGAHGGVGVVGAQGPRDVALRPLRQSVGVDQHADRTCGCLLRAFVDIGLQAGALQQVLQAQGGRGAVAAADHVDAGDAGQPESARLAALPCGEPALVDGLQPGEWRLHGSLRACDGATGSAGAR